MTRLLIFIQKFEKNVKSLFIKVQKHWNNQITIKKHNANAFLSLEGLEINCHQEFLFHWMQWNISAPLVWKDYESGRMRNGGGSDFGNKNS